MGSFNLRVLTSVVVVGILGPALASCSVHPDPNRTVPDDPISAARDLPGAPTWVAEPPAGDCGTTAVDESDVLSAEGRACLSTQSSENANGTIAWVLTTTEGDPIPHFARVRGTVIEIVSTSEFDAYGAAGWYRYECVSIDDLPYGESCGEGSTF